MPKFIKSVLLICAILFAGESYGQSALKKGKTRILFVLDASGSMKENWQSNPKIETAIAVLNQMLDSIANVNKNLDFSQKIEVGLRVFGHQHPRSEKNCRDTKLEVPFTNFGIGEIRKSLPLLTPQGYTPIAYSLGLSTEDFPKSEDARNMIVLITDGVENCDGDPCEVSNKLQRNGIILRPFIIGLGLNATQKKMFDCVGTVYNAEKETSVSQISKVVISNVLNPTSLQVNLINDYGEPKETDVNMTFFDRTTNEIKSNLYHTLNSQGVADTFYMEPLGNYDLKVHTLPFRTKKNITIQPGRKNITALKTPMGEMNFSSRGSMKYPDLKVIVSEKGKSAILNVQSVNTSQRYIVGEYSATILTLPEITLKSVEITQSKEYSFDVPSPGILNYSAKIPGVATVLIANEDKSLSKVIEIGNSITFKALMLQPGSYILIYRPGNGYTSKLTQEIDFIIRSNNSTTVRF
ncbi:MAG: Ca-activated chloride channel family protein [Sphingobacteriales bacterium]|jgi:Ca-activated chloride channel family protein